jgi:hypothetical protein
MIKWEKTMFEATDFEKLRAKRTTNTHFSGRFGDIDIIEKNYCSWFISPNLYIKQKLVFITHHKATEISH